MRKFVYTGKCAAGFVEFKHPSGESVRLPEGETVEVPDWLASKLEKNNHFKEVKAAEAKAEESKGGRKAKADDAS